MKAFDFARLVRLFASACAPVFLLVFATMVFGVAAPQRAEAAGTCTINWGTVAYRSTGNTYVMSQSVNAATLAACDPRYPAVDSGVAPPTSGTSTGGGTWSGVTNAADNTLTYTPQAGRIGPDTFTMYFCNDAGCSGAGRLTATVNVTIAAPTLTLTSSLPGGTQGTAYSQTLTAGGGTAGYTFSVISGSLPPGLSLGTPTTVNATTGSVVLSGTPTTGGTYNFTIRATDSSTGTGPATKDQAYTVNIISLTPTVTAISPTAGPTAGGTSVVITGTNLTGATAVNFGATAATGVTVNSATQITATAPAGTGTVDVRVTTSGGTSAISAADQYTYVAAPTVTSISPTAGPTAGGTTVVITGTNLSGATAVSFGGTAATGVTVNSATQITATAPAGTGTVDVRVTTVGGTSAVSAADQFTYVAAPTVTSVSPTSGPTGGGQTVTITGTGFLAAAGTGAVKFGATNATYTINSNTQITATSPANSAGTYDITVTTAGGTSATSAADQYTYIAAPTVTSVSPTAGPTAGGTTVTITGTGFAFAAGTGAVKFGASNATYIINSNTQITATSPANAAGTYDITVATAGGTSATSAADQYTYVAPPVASSQTYGSIVAYNDGSNQTTSIPVYLFITSGTPTSFAVGSATTAQGGSVSIDSSGNATYTPPVGFRNANDSFTYTATNMGGTSAPATVTITIGNPTITVSLPSGTATVERDYNAGAAAVTVSGGRAAYTINSISGLPSGLVDAGGGVISGRPAVNGTFNVTVNITDSSTGAGPYTANAAAILTVSLPPAPVVSSFSISGLTYNSGSATATTFSAAPHSTESPTGYQVGASSYGGTVSVDAAGLMSYTPPVGFRGTDTFNWVATNAGGTSNVGQVSVTVNDPVFAVTLPASTGTVGEAYNTGFSTVQMSGGNPPYNNFSATGLPAGLTMNASGVISGTPTTAGSFTVDVTVTDSSGGNGSYTSTASASLVIAAPTITLSPAAGALPGAQAGVSYSQTFSSTGGVAPITYAVTAGALPPGVTLDASGLASGTPTATGTYNFTVTGTDSSGNGYTGSGSYSTQVAAPVITVSPSTLSAGEVSVAYSQTLAAAGGNAPYVFTYTGALPPGLTLDNSGALTGTPTAAGSYAFTATATDSTAGGTYTGSQGYTLLIDPGTQTISFGALSNASLSASPLTLSATATSGLTVTFFSDTAAICSVSGTTLTLLQTGTCTIRAEQPGDSDWADAPSVSQSFTVTPAILTIDQQPASGQQVGVAYSQPNPAAGGVAPYTYSLAAGAFVPGTTVDPSTGVVSGTPTVAGSFSYIIRATDSQPLSVDTPVTTVTIAKGNQTVAFTSTPPSPALVGEPDYVLSATATSGLGVTFTLDGTSTGCTLSGNAVTFTTPGSCVINADQAGDSNWNAAAQVQQSFAVTANPPTVTNVSGVSVDFNTATLIDLSGSITGVHTSMAIAAGPSHGSVSVSGYVVTYTPAANYAGPDSFTFTATGVGGTSNVGTVSLTVSQGAQTISFGALSNASLSASPLTLSATASSGLAVTFVSDTTAICTVSGTSLTLLQTGTCTIRAEQSGDASWAAAPSVSQSFTVTPAILAITANAATGLKVGVAYSQANPATGGVAPYTYSLGAGAFVPGTTVNTATGEVSGTPTVAGSFSYIIRVTDSQPLSADTPVTTVTIAKGDQTISFSSTPASPVVGNPDYTVAATTTSGLPVVFTLDASSTGCTLSGSAVTFTTPGTCVINADQAGDSNWNPAAQVQQSFAVTANPPTVTNVSGVVVGFNTAELIDLSGSITGVRSSIAIATPPSHGSVTVSGEGVTYTPAANYAGPDSFTFTATGVGGTSNVGTVSLTVSQGAQTISFGALSNASLSASPLTLSATASSGLAVTFVSDTTAICTVSGASLTLLQTGTCTLRAEQAGDASWAAAPSVSQSFTVTPAILAITANAATGLKVGVAYSQANPATGGVAPYTYSLGAGAFVPGTTLDPSTGVVSGTPTVAGSFSYIIRVTDSQPLSADTGVTTVTIAKGNQTLAFTSTAPSAVVAGPAYDVTASATSGLAVTFTLDASSTGCVISGSSVTFTTPGTCVINANQAGDSNWNAAAQVQQSFAVIANPPIAADVPNVAVAYASPGTAIDLSASLTGGAHTAITIGTAPAHGTATVSGDVVTYIPAATYYGADSFTYTATGPGGTSNVATVSLTVATPAAPVAADKPGVAVPWNSSGTAIDLSASITGVHASIAIGAAPAHGTVTVAGDVVTYTPTAGYYGADSFTFTATGPGGTSNVATVSLTVANPPAPTVTAVSGVAVPYASTGTAITLQPSGVYTSLSVASAPAHGAVTISGTTATYTPAADYFGADSFTYTATGPGGTSAPATVSLTVATPPPPTVTPPTDPVVVPPSTGGGSQPVVVNLDAQVAGEIDGFRITVTAQHGSAVITQATAQAQTSGGTGPQNAPGDYQLTYTPAANFMGTDTVTVVAYGPGGDSAPLTFTFQVAGKAPDLSGATPSNGSITFSPTTTLVGGPFQALRITRAPAFGTATVNGLNIVFTPGVANGGSTSLDYVIDLPFGSSAAGRIDLVSNLVPGAQALTAETVQGHPVTVRISNTVGGPFTGAAVVSVSPTTAGTATIAGSGAAWDLTFTPTGTFSGAATVTFSLTNASGTTNGTLAVTVEARPDPGLDPEVRGVATSQVTTARRFADAQINNFQRRLQDLHDGTNASSNGMSLNLGLSQDDDRDPRQALRRQLGQTDHRLDPGALGDDRDREMLGLDLWSGRASANGIDVGGDRLNMAAGQPSRVAGGGAVGFWTSGSVDWGRQDADGTRDSRFTTQGVTAGLDVRVSDQLIIGGGLGYGEDKTRIGDNGSVSNGQAFTGALYASWRPADAFYIDGVLGYADLDFDSRRWVTGLAGQPDGYADGSRAGDVRFASASFGRVTTGEGFTTDLYARLDARDITLDGFTETGGGLSALIWSEVEQSSVSANLGASWRWVVDSRRYGTLVPSARIEWSHEFEDIGDQAVRYADWAASPNYLVPLTAWSRNSLNLDLDAEWSLSDRLVLGFGYRGALGDASTSHGAQIRVKYGW